ncbi:MAG: hypothetical protein PF481_02325 [Bacteroidales bacterium]|jgi:hypothetical protein|nr:hypothetical protein [Bacteroidales bacterium]
MSRIYILISIVAFFVLGCKPHNEMAVKQESIQRVIEMPLHPQPYKMLNWHEKAINFDEFIFDTTTEGDYRPFLWIDTNLRNINQSTFGLYTVIGDVRQGPHVNKGEFHEAINSLGALMSAGLVGIDKRNQDSLNYVKMIQNYFNSDNGWDIMMNNTCPEVALLGGGYGRDWWYDVFPNVLYYAVSDIFKGVDNADKLQYKIAEQFYKADSVLDGNYDYSYFNYSTLTGEKNQIPYQQDAAAGHAYVLYNAYQKFGEEKFLEGAISAMNALESQTESRFYEVLMPFGALTAARLNAEYNTSFDITKILDWTFEGCIAEDGRTGWGIISDRFGEYDVHGLQGSLIDGGGYAFLMNTFDMAWPLVPMVRYAPQYANSIGKWMLNATNASRLFYPYEIPDKNQSLPDLKDITRNIIAYEGIRKVDVYDDERLKGVSPVALGDGPHWVVNQPKHSMFSIYGSAHVGVFGSIVSTTNVEQVLRLNCLATDFYGADAYPTYLYYNPFDEVKNIVYTHSGEAVDLYDVLTGTIIAENVKSDTEFSIENQTSRLLIAIPEGADIEHRKGKTYANGTVIAF